MGIEHLYSNTQCDMCVENHRCMCVTKMIIFVECFQRRPEKDNDMADPNRNIFIVVFGKTKKFLQNLMKI